jgi:hypothetical protein
MAQRRKRRAERATVEVLARAKEANKLALMSKPFVTGLDVGFRVRGGQVTDEPVVKVYVSRKVPASQLAKEGLLPRTVEIDGKEVPVDVEESPIYQPHLFTQRLRPLRGGSSIGAVATGGVGTLGICVTLNDGNTYILSNNHVLANVNRAPIGAAIAQPSLPDLGTAANDVVATLSSFVPLDFGTTSTSIFGIRIPLPNPNFVDAALARVTNAYNVGNREIHWVGYPGFLPARRSTSFLGRLALLGRRVCKMGRTTEFTTGQIISVSFDTMIGPYANGLSALFVNQIRIQGDSGAFAQPGDSGSLVVDFETRAPIGLHFAGSGIFGIANPLEEVMVRLGIPTV